MDELHEFDIFEEERISFKKFFKVILSAIIIMKLLGIVFPYCIIKGQSMENTLESEEVVILNKLAYIIKEPKRGEIVIINVNENSHNAIAGKTIVKRIVGLPGEKLEIRNNIVYINDIVLEETYLKEEMITENIDILIPLDEVFVMGDNRNKSGDSRDFGTFKIKDIEANILFD